MPDALFRKPEDGLWAVDKVVKHQCGRRWYPPDVMDELRAMTFDGACVDPSGLYMRRRNEIVAAFDRWMLARKAACIVSGLDVAEAAATASGQRIAAFRDAILDHPAENFGDVLVKAAVVSWWYIDFGKTPSVVFAADRAEFMAKGGNASPLAMALALLSDLAAMAEARGITLERCTAPALVGMPEALIAASAA